MLVDRKGRLTGLKYGGRKQAVQAAPRLGTGTTIHFRPHRGWFDPALEWPQPQKNVPWEFDRIEARLEQVAHLHPGLRIELSDRRGPKKNHKKRLFYAKKGLLDYIERLMTDFGAAEPPMTMRSSDEISASFSSR